MKSLPLLLNRAVLSTPQSRAQSESNAITVALVILMSIPVALSFFFFQEQSIRLDEAQSLWQASRSIPEILSVIASDVHVPLYHVLLHMWLQFFGNSIETARLLSLIFYVASIPALYALGALAYGRRIGLFATLLYSLSPFMNWYGNEARMYTLFTLCIIANQYFFIRIFKSTTTSSTLWFGYCLSAILGVFSHYFFFLNLASQFVFLLWRIDIFPKGSFVRFAGSNLLVAAAFVPWVWYVVHLGQAGLSQPLLVVPTSVDLFNTFSQFIFGFQVDSLNALLLSLWPLAVVLGFLALRKGARSVETEFFVTTVLISFGIVLLTSFILKPIFVSRYLIFTLPALYLLLANVCAGYPPLLKYVVSLSVVAGMFATLTIEITNPLAPVKENYAEAVSFLNTHATVQDAIVLSAPFTIYPVEYYYRGPSRISTLPEWNQYAHGPIPAFSVDTLPTQVSHVSANAQNVYLLLSYDQGYEKTVQDYFEAHYHRLYTQTFSKDLTLYVYRVRYDTSLSAASSTLPS